MDPHAENIKGFQDFKEGKRSLFVVSSWPPGKGPPLNEIVDNAAESKGLPFILRKLNDHQSSIMAWLDRAAAEAWSEKNMGPGREVIELHVTDLRKLLDQLAPGARKMYSLELCLPEDDANASVNATQPGK